MGPEGLRVNAIVPGPIAGTEGMARLAPTAELLAACAQSVPMGRLGQVSDIADACLMLASPGQLYYRRHSAGGWRLVAGRGGQCGQPFWQPD